MLRFIFNMWEMSFFYAAGVGMAGTGEGKKEEADYKRLHSFPLIRVGEKRDSASGYRTRKHPDSGWEQPILH